MRSVENEECGKWAVPKTRSAECLRTPRLLNSRGKCGV